MPLPIVGSDDVDLADWLELSAATNRDQQVSLEQLMTMMRSNSVSPYSYVDLENLLHPVTTELISREKCSEYPFTLIGSSLEYRKDYGLSTSTYTFCLALSVLRRRPRIKGCFPERIFEEISTKAAREYLNGSAIRFASPRKAGVPSGFKDAIVHLIRMLDEGTSLRSDRIGNEKDAGVDVIAWKTLDSRPGKIMLFGSCSTGENWMDKLTEMNPVTFCENYFTDPPHPAPVKSFFTSAIIPSNRWDRSTQEAGILFDRLRISTLVPEIPDTPDHGSGIIWLEQVLKGDI